MLQGVDVTRLMELEHRIEQTSHGKIVTTQLRLGVKTVVADVLPEEAIEQAKRNNREWLWDELYGELFNKARELQGAIQANDGSNKSLILVGELINLLHEER